MSVIGDLVVKISANLTEFDKGLKKVEKTLKSTGEQFTSIGKTMSVGITAPLTALGGMSVKAFGEFEEGVAKVGTMLGGTTKSIQDVKNETKALSQEFATSQSEIADSMYQAISAGVEATQTQEFLAVALKASKGGFTDATTAVDGLTSVLNSYNLETADAEKIANQMLVTQNKGKTTFGELASSIAGVAPVAKQLNISTEEMFSSLAVLTANGLSTSESVTSLNAALSAMVKPTAEASSMAEALGIKFGASEVQANGLMPTLLSIKDALKEAVPEYVETIDKLSKVESEMASLEKQGKKNSDRYKELKDSQGKLTKQSELLAKANEAEIAGFSNLFGSVNGLNAVMVLTSEGGNALMNDTLKEMETNTTAVDDAFNQMADTQNNTTKQAWVDLQNAMIDVGNALAPVVSQIAEALSTFARKFSELSPEVQNTTVFIGALVAGIGPLLLGVGKAIGAVASFSGAIQKMGGFATIFGNITGAVSSMVSFVGSGVGAVVSFMGTVVSAVGTGISAVFSFIGSTISLIGTGITTAISFVGSAITTFGSFLASVGSMLVSAISTCATAIMGFMSTLASAISSTVVFLVTNPIGWFILGITAVVAIGVWMYKNWDEICAWWQETWSKVCNWWADFSQQIADKWSEIWQSVSDWWTNLWNGVTDWFKGKWGDLHDWWDGKVSDITDAVKGKFESIQQKIEDTIGGARDFVKDGIEKMKSFFNFEWSLPKIKLPHFSITGNFSLNPPSIPSFGVDWYDKGGIFSSAQIIGVGEKRPEFVGALDDLKMLMREVLHEEGGTGGEVVQLMITNFYNNTEQDIEDLADELAYLLKRKKLGFE